MTRDWLDWHCEYADPGSSLSRRRGVVQGYLRQALAEADGGPVRLLSMCAGDGGDVLPVLAEDGAPTVRALLVELDPELAERARRQASRLGLAGVEVATADAGRPDSYAGLAPAHIVLACGVLGNISESDVRRTVSALPVLLRPGGLVIWTRGSGGGDVDRSRPVRRLFAELGYAELGYTAPDDAGFRVGLHRRPTAAGPSLDALPELLFRFR